MTNESPVHLAINAGCFADKGNTAKEPLFWGKLQLTCAGDLEGIEKVLVFVEETVLARVLNQLVALRKIEFLHQVRSVRLDGAGGYDQLLRDIFG